jgi:hypothetical protein
VPRITFIIPLSCSYKRVNLGRRLLIAAIHSW